MVSRSRVAQRAGFGVVARVAHWAQRFSVPRMPHVLHPDTAFEQIMAKLPSGDEVILVKTPEKSGGTVHAYRNSCPHVGVGLDYGNGRCLIAPDLLQCALHGAVFEVGTGLCIDGPCTGRALERVAIAVVDGRVELASS